MQTDMISKKERITLWILANSHNDTQIFSRFVELVNSQINFNKNGAIHAIPIIGFMTLTTIEQLPVRM